MRNRSPYCLSVAIAVLAFVFFACRPVGTAAAEGAGKDRSLPFFSQGQAVYDPQDQAKSQQQAIKDLQGQALVQAIGKFMSPDRIGSQFSEIQKKILARSERYVDSYRVFSEAQAEGGLYRVIGQVTVAMDVLRKDLEEAGFQVAEAKAEKTGDAEQAQSRQAAAQGPARSATRGLAVTKKEILWVVPEKWEQAWVLPTDRRDVRSLFAQSMIRELGDYDYSLEFPQAGSVKMDIYGNIPPSQVVALAEGLGIREAVAGTVSYKRAQGEMARLETSLRVFRVPSGKAEGEVQKAQSMEELTNQEGALALASRVASRLDELLGGAGSGESAGAGQEEGEGGAAASAEGSGPWKINLPAAQYVYWREVERVLREQFKGMRVAGLEMGASEGTIRLEGIDGSFLSRMNGSSLPSGALIRIDSYSTEERAVRLSFTPPGRTPAEPQQ